MLTIKTKPDCTLGFVKLEYPAKKIIIEGMRNPELGQWGYVDKEFTPDTKEWVGKLSEITEEQARELVEPASIDETMFKWNFKSMEEWKEIREKGIDPIEGFTYRGKLRSAALSVGIKEEDFGNYLVLKL